LLGQKKTIKRRSFPGIQPEKGRRVCFMQEELAIANKVEWETKAYQAWIQTYATPVEGQEHGPIESRYFSKN